MFCNWVGIFFFFSASRTRRHAALCRVCLKLSFVPRREQHNQGSVLFKDHNVGRSFSLGLRCFASAALAEVMRPPTFTPQPFSPHTWCDEETQDSHFARWLSLKRQRWTDGGNLCFHCLGRSCIKKKKCFHLYSTWSLTVVCNFMRWDNLTHHMVHWLKPCFSGEFRGGKSQRISGQTLSFMFKQVNEIFYCQFRTYWRSCWSQELGRGGQEM